MTTEHQPVPGEDDCRCGKILPCDDADRQAPRDDAGRTIDRTMAAAVLDRLDRGKTPIPGEVAVLRAVLAAEQDDADQAREQLAAARTGDAPWIKAYGEDIEQARQGETEAVRRAEATGRAYDAARKRAARYAERLLIHRAAAERNRNAWRNARKRAAVLSAEVTRRAPLQGEYAARAERAEAAITRVRAVAGWAINGWSDLDPQKVLAALGDPQPANEPERCGQYGGHGEYCDYPREPGSEQCAFHAAEARTHDAEPADPCAHGCRQAADDLTRLGQEIDAEPRGSITDHTYEAADGLCGADFLGHICGAARDDHDLTEPEQPAEPLLRGTAPLVLSLDIAPAEIAALLSKVRRAARAMRKAGLL